MMFWVRTLRYNGAEQLTQVTRIRIMLVEETSTWIHLKIDPDICMNGLKLFKNSK